MDPEIIQNNTPMKFYLNVQGPNPYFIFASFLLQVEELKHFEYTIHKSFTANITKIKEKPMSLGDEDNDSYEI
jgi:hypothetical protein